MIKKFNLIGYHITRRKNIPSIKNNGLIPKIPEDYGENGDIKGVYLFKSYTDCENALYNWLGERIEEWEEETGKKYDEVLLKINLTGLQADLINSVEFEWICINTISPERIISIIEI